MDLPPPAPDFFDVEQMLERSQPRPRGGWLWMAMGGFLLIVVVSAFASSRSPAVSAAVDLLAKLAMVALMAGIAVATSVMVKKQREEVRQLEALEELIQLRRWPEAAGLARELLWQPTRTPQARAQALILLAGILARYQRFEDAIRVHSHLLETIRFDDSTAHGIRLGRAMAMLREDHLVDADGAISELRRTSPNRDSAGLALIQLYRDVKTGHPNEAVEHFDAALPLFRQQLGHRTGDAYGLLAKAYDMLGRTDEARLAYEKATLLTPASELNRRYPEVATLAARYAAAPAPAELGVAA
ncbi:MAG TPA: tetratricopeptide repeat protein [Tepidisphaeraceae bacterium]|nr:tetratricopeptide repeat protein [Tepidisphaeraceae bacterium]